MIYTKYKHHGNTVWVRENLKGKHWDYCLCAKCMWLNTEDRKKNCHIAEAVYALCLAGKLVTPVWECPNFVEVK